MNAHVTNAEKPTGGDFLMGCIADKIAQMIYHITPSPTEQALLNLTTEIGVLKTKVIDINKELHAINGEYVDPYGSQNTMQGLGSRINYKLNASSEQTIQNLRNEIVGMRGTLERNELSIVAIRTEIKPLLEKHELEADLATEDWGKF